MFDIFFSIFNTLNQLVKWVEVAALSAILATNVYT